MKQEQVWIVFLCTNCRDDVLKVFTNEDKAFKWEEEASAKLSSRDAIW